MVPKCLYYLANIYWFLHICVPRLTSFNYYTLHRVAVTEIDQLLFNAAGSIFDVARQRSSSVRGHRLNPLKICIL